MDIRTEQIFESLYSSLHLSLQKLTGLHRQLMETVRLEREALLAADLKGIEDATLSKQLLVETIRQAETERLRVTGELAQIWKKPLRDLTLPLIVTQTQTSHPKLSEQLRSAYNALSILIKRITEQNRDNHVLVQNSLMHIHEMKKNVLSEAAPKANTYNPKGQKSSSANGARIISTEV
jgi:aromatic ring-cleaving dioxygenase